MGRRSRRWITLFSTGLIALLAVSAAHGRTSDADIDKYKSRTRTRAAAPFYCVVGHRVNQLVLAVNNNGTFGTGFSQGQLIDCLTGTEVKSAEYPKGSNTTYLFAASFWIGAVVGRDTLVSVGADGWQATREMVPDEGEAFGEIKFRSITDPTSPEFEDAISEEDYIAQYTDTIIAGANDQSQDVIDGRPHQPLNIAIEQRSYAWSYDYAEDFVLFDYEVRNIGFRTLEEVYMGVYVDGDVGPEGDAAAAQDDITGFLKTLTLPQGGCQFEDTVDIAWLADNDGDPEGSNFVEASATAVTATRIVRTPNPNVTVSYNWWISNGTPSQDFGPRHKANPRDFGTGGRGTPEGDRNKYYVLSNGENDYDQVFTGSITSADTLWELPPQENALIWSRSLDTRYLLSFGPFEIKPGDRLPISLAYVAGADFHQDPSNFENNLLSYDPQAFYDNLGVFDLGINSRWASWIYDNPGVDTDNNGSRGSFRLCCTDSLLQIDTLEGGVIDTTTVPDLATCDTLYWIGDGVPDFRGASPPPAPGTWQNEQGVSALRIIGSENALTIRWNGLLSETTEDPFSNVADFEGYRVYLALDDRATSYSVLASYDRENYNRWTLDPRPGNPINFSLVDIPFTLDSLRELYGDNFDPLNFTRNNPFRLPGFPDSVFFFERQDFNVSELGIDTEIRKRFPAITEAPVLDPQTGEYILAPDDTTENGFIKFYEYEYEIDSLLPTIPYWINVTAFDFGSPVSGLPSLESAVTLGADNAYTDATASEVRDRGLDVFVYPNPYLNEGEYLDRGFERLRNEDGNLRSEDRSRQVTFQNLPPRARISIFSLDGDLVREIVHDWSGDPNDPLSGRTEWDLITRNTQLAVSGLYYWTVEDLETGEVQIGKLMLIM